MEPAPIFLISGPPGAGKSSVARGLAARFPFGVHIPVDDLREWVVAGIAHPVPDWTEETARQFHLARTAAARVARLYAQSGFAVVIDDVLFPADFETSFMPDIGDMRVRRVLLLPDEAVAQQRNRERTGKNFDPALLVDTIRAIHAAMRTADFKSAGWQVIDSSQQSIADTITAILDLDGIS